MDWSWKGSQEKCGGREKRTAYAWMRRQQSMGTAYAWMTRVGQIRQPSSSIRTEPETETHVSVLNQLLTEKNSGEAQKHRKRLRKAIRSEMHHTLHAPIGVVKLLLLLSGSSGSYGFLFATRAISLLSPSNISTTKWLHLLAGNVRLVMALHAEFCRSV